MSWSSTRKPADDLIQLYYYSIKWSSYVVYIDNKHTHTYIIYVLWWIPPTYARKYLRICVLPRGTRTCSIVYDVHTHSVDIRRYFLAMCVYTAMYDTLHCVRSACDACTCTCIHNTHTYYVRYTRVHNVTHARSSTCRSLLAYIRTTTCSTAACI